MNNFDYKNMTPFKWFVLENFPFIENDFDAINNYHLFSKVVEYLNKTIDNMNLTGEQMENVTNAMTELQNYVNESFSNLNLQEEVNNKLDEMAESGQLQEIFNIFFNLNTIRSFDNIEEFTQSESLVKNSVVKTLGYHNINDNGLGLYKVIEDNNNEITPNNGTIIQLDNNLKGLLVYNELNIRQFGAYGDGIHDDTESIQNAINYIDSFINSETIGKVKNVLVIDNGIYKVTSKIIIPPYLKIKCIGNPILASYVNTGATIAIEYTKSIFNNDIYYNTKTSFMNGDIISGGLTIIYQGENLFSDTSNTNIGLSVGNVDTTYINDDTSRFRISDINIYNFSTGLLLNRINTYCIDFNHFHIEHNYTNIKIGNGSFASATNSGENVTFSKCIIAGAVYGVYWNTGDFFSTVFNDCSFDFLACVFYFPNYTTANVNIFGGHIESVGYYNSYLPNIDENTLPAFGCVGYYAGARYPNGFITLQFFGTWIQILSTNYKTNRFKAVVSDIFGVAFNNTRFLLNNNSNVDDTFICNENVVIINSNYDIVYNHDVSRNRLLLSQKLDKFNLDDYSGDITTDSFSTNDVKSGYRLGNVGQISLWSFATGGLFSDKVLKFTPGETTSNFIMYRKIYTEGKRMVIINPIVKSNIMSSLKLTIGYKFYDNAGNELLSRNTSTDNIVKYKDVSNTLWNKASSAYCIDIPSQCDYVEVSLYCSKSDNTAFGSANEIYINGLFMNLI